MPSASQLKNHNSLPWIFPRKQISAFNLIFTKSDGAKKTLSIADPREGLTLAEAKTAADKIIAANVLTSGGLELTEFTEARIKTVTIDVLA